MEFAVPFLTFSILIMATITDIRAHRIPDWLTLPGAAVALVAHLLWPVTPHFYYFMGLVPALLLLLLAMKRRFSGGGDIKLMMFLGLSFGGLAPMYVLALTLILLLIYKMLQSIFHFGKDNVAMAPYILAASTIIFLFDLSTHALHII